MSNDQLTAPFPWPGGKRRLARAVWNRLGDPQAYLEPCGGGLAVLLGRPDSHRWWERIETVGDADGFVTNFWRAVRADPTAVAAYMDHPVTELDLAARHIALARRRPVLTERLISDPEWCDPKVAGWWAWGVSAWVGDGYASSIPPKRPLVSHSGRGVHRALQAGAVDDPSDVLDAHRRRAEEICHRLANRLRRVRVVCGDAVSLLESGALRAATTTGILLDPPYAGARRLYAAADDGVSRRLHEWALAHGGDASLRIALCGLDGEHDDLADAGWTAERHVGHGLGAITTTVVWFSPGCLPPDRLL